jgi:hypothetical protein
LLTCTGTADFKSTFLSMRDALWRDTDMEKKQQMARELAGVGG